MLCCKPKRPRLADFGLRDGDARDFTRPYYGERHTIIQAVWITYRLITALWFIGVILWFWFGYAGIWTGEALKYLSNWTVHGYAVYACVAALNVILDRMCMTCYKDAGGLYAADDHDTVELRIRHMLQWALSNTFISAAIIVAFIFWTIINTRMPMVRDTEAWAYDILVHILPAILGLIDVCFSAVPVRCLHVIYCAGYFLLYFIFNIIYWAATNRVTYKFLDFDAEPGGAVGYSVMMAIIVFITHGVVWGIHCLKRFMSKKGDDPPSDNEPINERLDEKTVRL